METLSNIISAIIAAGAPSVAFLALTNQLAADVALGILAVAGLAAFAVFDYTRPTRSLAPRAQILRPTLPVVAKNSFAGSARRAA